MSTPIAGGLRKVRRATFVQVPSSTIRDAALSFRARGVLAFLLDHPDGWTVDAAYVARNGREGREAVEAALRELRAAGYYRLERRRLPGGSFAMGGAIAEEPVAEWAASHQAHNGRAVPVAVLDDGTVVELEPPVDTGNGFPGPGATGPEGAASGAPLPYTEGETDSDAEGGALEGDVTSEPSPAEQPSPWTLGLHPTCPDHRLTPAAGPCGGCGRYRRAYEAAEAERTAEARLIAQAREEADRALTAAARVDEARLVRACRLCDDDGVATVRIDLDDPADVAVTACRHDEQLNLRTVRARRAALDATPRTRATAHRRARGLATRGA